MLPPKPVITAEGLIFGFLVGLAFGWVIGWHRPESCTVTTQAVRDVWQRTYYSAPEYVVTIPCEVSGPSRTLP